MATIENIYGTDVYIPEPPPEHLIDGCGLPAKEQKWRRKELPDFFNYISYDKNDNALLSEEQKAYASQEVFRCKHGYWFFNNGKATYITGKNYFYLQWWKLEDDQHPSYRNADRGYFLFLNHWENVLWCIGIGRGKKRREGASSQATSNLIWECVFYTNSNTGLVSKTDNDSKDTFTDMVAFGYYQLPVFLKPRQLNRVGSVTELVFAAKVDKTVGIEGGQKSKVSFRAPVLNAYDRGRMSRLLADEGGKWPKETPFSKFISIVTKTMIKGAKRVGFCEAPSTVNEMTKGGGKEFKIFWDGADQFVSKNKKTDNRFVTYFTPAYDNYEGFIDEHGMSVIDAPTPEQYEYLVKKWVVKDPNTGETVSEVTEEDIRKGAKVYVYGRRENLRGDLLEEEIRMNPCTVQEMFEAANTGCAFNSYNINKRRAELKQNPLFKRHIIYYRDEEQKVKWRDVHADEKNFCWHVTQAEVPNDREGKPQHNKYTYDDKLRRPARTEDGCITVDSYSNSQGGRKYGSKASAWIGRRFDILDPQNSGKVFGHLYGRPAVKETLHEQVMLAAEYHGYKVWYEHTADDYLSYFRDRGRAGYLGTYPLSTIDPIKREKADRYKGFPTTPFSLTKQLDSGVAYFEHHCDLIDFDELLENALIFDPYDRTAYDAVVSFLMWTVCITDPVRKPISPGQPLIRVYEKNEIIEY